MGTVALRYLHTQKAPLCLILYDPALACLALAGVVGGTPGGIIAVALGLVVAPLSTREIGSAFHPRPDAEHRPCSRWHGPDYPGRLGAASPW
jgi:hypothetical protein